ncbi:MAG: EamA family transporter [Candidatus Moranbacteria bacterium]|nr:EamA family transporter [Candidatus Moranbacteria bacterium]
MNFLENIFSFWQVNLFLYFVTSVIFMQSYKTTVKDANHKGVTAIILQIVASASVLVLVPFFAFKIPADWKLYALMILASVFYALNDRMQVSVRKHLEVSVYSIVGQLSKVFLVVYGILIFHEPFIWNKIFGGLIILAGNVFLFYKKGKFRFNKYVLMSFLASFLMATALIIDVDISKHFNFPFYIMLTLLIPAVIIFLFEKCSVGDIVKEFNSQKRNQYLITGVSWGFGIFFTIRALQTSEVIFMAPLLAISVLLNVAIASIIHKEKDKLFKKIIAAILVIIGVYFVSM